MFDLLQGFRLGMPIAMDEGLVRAGTALLILFIGPAIAILTHHQRKMAEIIHRNQPQQIDPHIEQQLATMQSQITNLTAIVQQNIIDNDQNRPTQSSVEQRLNQ